MATTANNQTLHYTFIANYLIYVAFALVLWMAFCPLLVLRRKPAQALNWVSK